MRNDRTSQLEKTVNHERKPKFVHLISLFAYAFSSAKVISCIYLGFFILLSFLRPILAFMWGSYIETAETLTLAQGIIPTIILITAYFIINFFADLISRYVMLQVQIERLDIVQANRQQELMHTKMYERLSKLSPEAFEIPKINDRVTQVFNFAGGQCGGLNITVMMQAYMVIAKLISVATIAITLFIFNPWLTLLTLVAPLPTLWSLTTGLKLRFKFIKANTQLQRKADYFQGLMLSPQSKELKTLGLYDFFYKKWKAAVDEYTLNEKKVIRTMAILQIVNYFLLALANVGGSVFAIVLMTMGRLTLGALGAVLTLTNTLVNDTKMLLAGFATFIDKKNEAAMFFDLMKMPEQTAKTAETARAVGDVFMSAKDVKYRYPLTERYVLDGISLQIKRGEKVAFVGENGMGKTTFVKLITGILTPSEGELLINDNVHIAFPLDIDGET